MADLLAVYTAASGKDASVALDVTLTIVPERRARIRGTAACVTAITPNVFVSNTSRVVGLPPMEYLLAWRMAVARDLLRRERDLGVAEIARRVGYDSASTFSTAFSRHVGQPPSRFARAEAGAAAADSTTSSWMEPRRPLRGRHGARAARGTTVR